MIWKELLKNIYMQPAKDLTYYYSLFNRLRRDSKNGGAPHKPILLISLIQAFQQNLFQTNKIQITPELVGLFKSNWNNLVTTNHQCLFTLPFYHMSSEPFWKLIPNIGCEIWVMSKSSMRSFANLSTAIKYVEIDEELKDLMANHVDSVLLIEFLLEKYFPESKNNYNNSNYFHEIKSQILEESLSEYQQKILSIKTKVESEEFQEEIFIRSNIFKKEIPKIYNYTCCISGLRIDAIDNISVIDACHIIPFSESYNDNITNGLALCPNLHRAYDRGLITINERFQVIVNTNFTEQSHSPYSIRQFNNKQIHLPNNSNYHPSIESLRHHMRRFRFI